MAGSSSTSTELTTENSWAPELGLEPRTTRLTEDRGRPEYAHLRVTEANVRPMFDALVHSLLRVAMSGETVPPSALIELAGAVQRVAEDAVPAAPSAPARPRPAARLRVVT